MEIQVIGETDGGFSKNLACAHPGYLWDSADDGVELTATNGRAEGFEVEINVRDLPKELTVLKIKVS